MQVILAASLWACRPEEGPHVTVTQPTPAPTETQALVEPPAPRDNWRAFADENGHFVIEVPIDWEYSQSRDDENGFWYWDSFHAPDEQAGIQSIVYDNGSTWTPSASGKEARFLLDQFYSDTGDDRGVRITDDSYQQDGSERLTWTSTGRGRSGISFFEVRDSTTFLMFSVWWADGFEYPYGDLLAKVIATYRVP
jgi:hypothetical protein